MNQVSFFPKLNALLNGTAFLLLFLGWLSIRKGQQIRHVRYMVSALLVSTLFLVSYSIYHLLFHGITRYQGQGMWRTVYFSILVTHTILAVAIIPFIVTAVRRSMRLDFVGHKRITRRLLPVWMYVSITGVIIYFMLYRMS